MTKLLGRIFSSLLLIVGVDPAFAITINDDAGVSLAIDAGIPFSGVAELRFANSGGGYGLCSGALVSAKTIVTAQHCTNGYSASSATAIFDYGGARNNYRVLHIYNMLGYNGNIQTGSDISIIEIDSAVNDINPHRFTNEFIVSEQVRFVGYGLNGTGSSGHEGTRDGERWAADNTIDAYSVGDNASGSNFLYYADFDNPVGTANTLQNFNVTSSSDMLALEGSTAGGDSGGPLFVLRDDEWVIAGVLSGGLVGGVLPYDSSYGAISFWTGFKSTEAQSLLTDYGGAQLYSTSSINPPRVPEINGRNIPIVFFIIGVLGLALQSRQNSHPNFTTTA